MEEEWKKIKGYEDYYEISSLGRVKSLIRKKTRSRNRPTTKKENILTHFLNNSGYPNVKIKVNGKQKGFLIHRLVAEHFIENPNNYTVVNHKNGDKRDFSIPNLEWTTPSLNQKHAYATGLRKKKISNSDKIEILKLRKEGYTYYKIADIFNVSYQIICRICIASKKTIKKIN